MEKQGGAGAALRKNQRLRAEITGYTSEGQGVAHTPGGVVFVPDAVAGEAAELRVVHVGSRGAWAEIERLETVSPHRVDRKCPLGKRCGGCAFWHMDYEEELRLKSQRVRDALARIGGADLGRIPILGAPSCEGYRNKAQYPVAPGKDGPAAGFYRARTHDVLPVARCLIQTETADLAKDAVLDWMRRNAVPAYDEGGGAGCVRHIYVRTALATGEVLVCVVACAARLRAEDDLVRTLRAAVPGLRTVVLNVNQTRGGAVLGETFRTLWGGGTITEELCGLRFRLSAKSFFQVNPVQAARLYEKAVAMAAPGPEGTALDLYCGTGTITLLLARRAGRAVGVETVGAAVADARENARENGIENVEFFCADAGQAAQRLADEGVTPDVVLVDPPRKGLSPDVIAAAARMAPRRIVYVSCDPATLARDVARLRDAGYEAVRAEAVDMFPRCAHVETVVLLSRVEK